MLPAVVYVDNQSAIKIAENDIEHYRTKHIDIKYKFVTDEINQNNIKLKWVPSNNQKADIFTKNLGFPLFKKFREELMKEQ